MFKELLAYQFYTIFNCETKTIAIESSKLRMLYRADNVKLSRRFSCSETLAREGSIDCELRTTNNVNEIDA